MKTRIDFHRWYSMLNIQRDLFRKEGENAKVDQDWVYDQLTKMFVNNGDAMSIVAAGAERWWYNYGCPYFKVWPQMALELGNVNLNIDGKYLYLPFDVFEVCFPKEPAITEFDGAPRLTALLVTKMNTTKRNDGRYDVQVPYRAGDPLDVEMPDDGYDRDWQFIVNYQFDTDIAADWMGWFYSMGIYEGRTLEDGFESTWKKGIQGRNFAGVNYQPGEKFIKSLVKIAVSCAFFGIHDHQVVMPDIPNRYVDRYHRARKAGDKKEMERLTDRAKALRHFGWKIGSEIDLPEPIVRHVNETGEKPERRELQFGYARSGHMRLQPYGPRDNPQYRLQFIRPHMVRPDLPVRAMHGYRLQDEVLDAKSGQ